MARAIIYALITAYFVYRFSLTARSSRARREGDWDRAGELARRGHSLGWGLIAGTTVLVVVPLVIGR